MASFANVQPQPYDIAAAQASQAHAANTAQTIAAIHQENQQRLAAAQAAIQQNAAATQQFVAETNAQIRQHNEAQVAAFQNAVQQAAHRAAAVDQTHHALYGQNVQRLQATQAAAENHFQNLFANAQQQAQQLQQHQQLWLQQESVAREQAFQAQVQNVQLHGQETVTRIQLAHSLPQGLGYGYNYPSVGYPFAGTYGSPYPPTVF